MTSLLKKSPLGVVFCLIAVLLLAALAFGAVPGMKSVTMKPNEGLKVGGKYATNIQAIKLGTVSYSTTETVKTVTLTGWSYHNCVALVSWANTPTSATKLSAALTTETLTITSTPANGAALKVQYAVFQTGTTQQ